MTIKDDMKARLASILSGMLKDGGGNRDAPYLTALQVQTISSTVIENFFIIDRNELMTPKVAPETGRAARYLSSLDHNLFPNVQADDSWDLACEKLTAAIHDIEALELCREWKEKKDAEDKELRTFARNLFNLSHPRGTWSELSDRAIEEWINIARNAKKLLT
jgi:hypothetical protein